MPDQRDAASPQSEIDAESATVLPTREAMSIIDPSFLTRVMPPTTSPADPPDQIADESTPPTTQP